MTEFILELIENERNRLKIVVNRLGVELPDVKERRAKLDALEQVLLKGE